MGEIYMTLTWKIAEKNGDVLKAIKVNLELHLGFKKCRTSFRKKNTS